MKPKFSLPQFLVIVILLAMSHEPSAISQIPQGFNYQAIARDAETGNPITDPVDVKIAILSDDDPVTIIREELFSAVDPDEHGLFSLVVGKGSYVSGLANFSDIDWTVTPKYILTKIYYSGDWQNLGPAQLWSVPYAMYSPSTNPWSLNGSSLYYAGGYVGINTSTPATPLTVTYNNNTGVTYPLYLVNASGDWTATEKGVGLKFGRVNPTSGHDYGTIRGTIASNNGGAGRLQFTGGGGTDPHVTIDHIGNVGIGTTSPEYQLHTTANVRLNNSVVGDGIEMSFYSTGNRYSGIDFHGDDTYTDYALRIIRNNTGPDAESRIEHRGTGELSLQTDEAAPITFRTSYAERLRIAANGNIGIGTPNPGSNKLFINGGSVLVSDGTGLSGTLKLTGHSYIGSADWGNLSLFAGSNSGNATMALITENVGRVYIKGNGNVGIGTDAPSGRLDVAVPISEAWTDETPLFEVKNNHGIPVLAVYNNGVRILVEHEPTGKGPKGGFAIGGYDYTKAGRTVDFMRITPDTIRFNINNDNTKGPKGGFAIGGFDVTGKGDINQDFMSITPQNSNHGKYNAYVGHNAGKSNTGDFNAFMGDGAGAATSDANWNTLIGSGAGSSIQTSSFNTMVGAWTGIQTTGEQNTFIGTYAGWINTTGSYNTYVGQSAGENNIGSYNVFVGYKAGQSPGDVSNKLFIDNGPTNKPLIWGEFSSTAGRKVVIDGNSTDNPFGFKFYVNGSAGGDADWNIVSDARFKKDIVTIDYALNKVMHLRGVYFNWNDSTMSDEQQMGFIAQEAVEIIPQVVHKSNGYYSMSYASVSALTVEAIKEQQGIIQEQQKQIESQQQQIDELKAMVEKLMVK